MTEKPATPKRTAAPAAAKTVRAPAAKKPAPAAAKPVPVAAKPAPKASTAVKPAVTVPKKPKKVRDSFSMPQNDYDRIDSLKKTCQKIGVVAKKSELLRAGLRQLGKLKPAELKQALADVQAGK